MNYLLIYLLIGVIYAGFTFNKTLKFIVESGLEEDERKMIVEDEEDDDLKQLLLWMYVSNILIALLKIPFYPIFILAGLGAKRNV